MSRIHEPPTNAIDGVTVWRDVDSDGVIIRVRQAETWTRMRWTRSDAVVLADAVRDALAEMP